MFSFLSCLNFGWQLAEVLFVKLPTGSFALVFNIRPKRRHLFQKTAARVRDVALRKQYKEKQKKAC